MAPAWLLDSVIWDFIAVLSTWMHVLKLVPAKKRGQLPRKATLFDGTALRYVPGAFVPFCA